MLLIESLLYFNSTYLRRILNVSIADRVSGLEVLTPYGAAVGKPVQFSAMAIQSDGRIDSDVDTHYVWAFGEMVRREIFPQPVDCNESSYWNPIGALSLS